MKRGKRIDNGHPTTSFCERCHAPKDPMDRYCRNCGRRLDKRPVIDRMAEEADRMCAEYCKWPDLWDEDAEMMPLNESRYCKNCPLTSLLGCAAGKYAGPADANVWIIGGLSNMTENDYIAEYVRERRPELITSFDYVGWKMCRIFREAIRNIARALSGHSGQEAEEKDDKGEKDAQINEEAAVRPEDQRKDL